MGRRQVLWALAAIGMLAVAGWAWWNTSPPGSTPTSVMAPGISLTEAIGSVDDPVPQERSAFEITDAFPPMPEPKPGDWLAVHDEPPQTVEAYLASEPNEPVAPRNVLYIQPVGPMPPARGPSVEELSRYAHEFFTLEVRVLPTLDPQGLDVTRRVHYGHRQINATDVLDRMEPGLPDDAYCVIAVTWSDLYPDDAYNFVFGLARLTARVGVFSFARLHPDFYGDTRGEPAVVRRQVKRRALAVMSHEIGHMFGLHHCVFFGCNMNGSNSLEESDRQPMHLCPVCLRKLHVALGFDPEQRYEALEQEYARAGLAEETGWVRRRLAFLAGRSPP